MCGIVGFIGKGNVKENLISLLKDVEYRGYDSAGIAYVKNNKIEVIKSVGAVKNLEKKLGKPIFETCGIAHTRWATHGKVNVVNAHPHISQDRNWAVVHNGIIENYLIYRNQLKKQGVKFATETDTEVIAQMLGMSELEGIYALKDVCGKLDGSYAVAAINKNCKEIFVAKNKSPLYVGISNSGTYIASDPICFCDKCNKYFKLNDQEFGKITSKSIELYDKNLNKIKRKPIEINFHKEDANLGAFEHFMQKEILQVPNVLQKIAQVYSETKIFEKMNDIFLKKINKVVLIGCGTAYHASLMGAKFIEKYAKIEAIAHISSEFRYTDPIIDDRTLAIFVSQSGETADTLGALDLVKTKGACCVALTNVLHSTLASQCEYIFPVCAGVERAVASTKAYTAQITILYLFAQYLNKEKSKNSFVALKNIRKLISNTRDYINQIKLLSKDLIKASNIFFIGKDVDFVTAKEASLKLKEITYINSQAYPSGELKHGFLALVDSQSILFVIATQKKLLDKTLNSAHEAYSRGAKVVVVSQLDIDYEKFFDDFVFIKLKVFEDELMPISSIEFFQWLAYYTSVLLGIDSDKPRNLAKSVTVEWKYLMLFERNHKFL